MPSLAQNLPMLILERIVDVYVGDIIPDDPTIGACFCKPYIRIAALLATCHWWREAALDKFYKG
ncbi:hypothetical protein DL89DRAFT_267593, partial [Linderina pennispora]